MNLLILAGVAAGLAATPPTGLVHHAEVPHGAGSVRVSYHGDVAVTHRQVGMSLPGRMGTARCTWKAEMHVERRVTEGATAGLFRTIDAGEAASGSRHGDCLTVRRAIAREVAQAEPRLRQALAQAAVRDRLQLAADLDSVAHTNARLAR